MLKIILILVATICLLFMPMGQGNSEPIVCPYCQSPGPHDFIGSQTTLMTIHSWVNENGTWHHDDPNITASTFKCRKCGKEFSIK